MTTRTKSAEWQKTFRQRMRDRGLVPKSVYILPHHSILLGHVEKALRQQKAEIDIIHIEGGKQVMAHQGQKWTTTSLFNAICESDLVITGQATAKLIDGIDPAIDVAMHEYGDLPIVLAVYGGQMFCSTALWDSTQVKDPVALNEALLLMNPLNPLSNFGLSQLPNGNKIYTLFGELSASSTIEIVIEELDMLARNTIDAVEGFVDQLI